MNEEDFMNWINSLSPVVIEVDEEGTPNPAQLNELADRIISEIDEIKDKQNGHQETNNSDRNQSN